ncbi:MAG: hypothetical protein IPK50_01400 [Fibrobacterota bacterium]|nr:hypothetical protein [Fibrobacterota bacterium]QQS05561.1 MAG: hypothetical protein IPK50_01400 [Fibrobacterota bacterium]
MKYAFRIFLLTSALIFVGCDKSATSPTSSGTPGPVVENIVTTFPGLDFESIIGDIAPGTMNGHSISSISGVTSINRSTPLSGTASARITSILNGTNYDAYTWNHFSWDMNGASTFILDMSGARGICFRIRANKSHKVDVVPNSLNYTADQNNAGAQFTWTISVSKTASIDTLLFEEIGYPTWLWDAKSSSGVCGLDSARYCPHTVQNVISRSPGINFTINSNMATVSKDSVTLDIDDIKLVY